MNFSLLDMTNAADGHTGGLGRTTLYPDLTDPEFLGYDQKAKKAHADIAARQAVLDALQKELNGFPATGNDTAWSQGQLGKQGQQQQVLTDARKKELQAQIDALNTNITSLQGQAQIYETQRENRGAVVTQGGVNAQVGTAGAEAVKSENLLAQNINQELQGRIATNTSQAREAQAAVDKANAAVLGQQAARAGQAGYSGASGTSGAMADVALSKAEADKAAIEGYRAGYQNLLMGQGSAATKAAQDLTGSILTQTADWNAKSTAAVTDVTGNLLTNTQKVVDTPGGLASPELTQSVQDSQAAVGTTLDTWSLKSYQDVLSTLTSHSANKSTWDQMLLDKTAKPVNPYSTYETAISPLTPIAGTQSNLLAAAAGAPDNVYTLSGTKNNTGSLL